jgi:hypothetical protein
MNKKPAANRRWIVALALLVVVVAWIGKDAARFLVVNDPRPSDVILVLAGEWDRRPARALELLNQGYGRRIVLDVPAGEKIYEFTQTQLAEQYIRDLPQGSAVSICPIYGLSTKDESKDAEKCLERESAKTVLLVTSEFHTRRALSVFRREIPGRQFSVAAARNEQHFGEKWWKHREWSKTLLDEWLRLVWWKVVDQWRGERGRLGVIIKAFERRSSRNTAAKFDKVE